MSYKPTAAEVKSLREQTGIPMMDCKKALVEAEGNIENAIDYLRKQGGKIQSDAAGRETTQGRIEAYEDDSVVAVAQMACEQAPTAKNETFSEMVKAMAKSAAMSEADPTPELVLEQPDTADSSKKIGDRLQEAINQIRENMSLSATSRIKADGGVLGCYVHFNYQEAAIARLEGSGATKELANDICMHIVASKPVAIGRDDVSSELVDKERKFAEEQAAESGKPPEIAKKIAEGKLGAWFSDIALLEQDYVKGEGKVADVLKDAKVTAFHRFKIG